MSDSIIEVENISKQYRLGEVSTGTVAHDLNRWWARMRGKEDPTLSVTHSNNRTSKRSEDPDFSGKNSSDDYVWALKDINFEVKRGEVLGIIGRNGAGKSTLLKILSRITAPTTGEIRLDGRIASLLEVGTGFHPELTGRENIFLNGAIMGMTKAEIRSKLDEIVEFSGCALYLDTPVKRFSSGMVVRLGFSVAAHLEPDILIVDEVLAVGDAEFQKKCIGKMQDVAGQGRTVLFVSHNMGAVADLCSQSIVLSEGRVVFDGVTEEALDHYMLRAISRDLSMCKLDGELAQCLRLQSIRVNEVSATEGRPSIVPGTSLCVEVQYELTEQIPFICCLSIGTGGHDRVFTIHEDTSLHSASGVFISRFYIDPNPLRPGIYSIHVGGYSGPAIGCLWAWASEVGSFEIMEIWSDSIRREDTGVVQVSSTSDRLSVDV